MTPPHCRASLRGVACYLVECFLRREDASVAFGECRRVKLFQCCADIPQSGATGGVVEIGHVFSFCVMTASSLIPSVGLGLSLIHI